MFISGVGYSAGNQLLDTVISSRANNIFHEDFMTKFTAFINNEEIELINYQGQACVNLLQAREATKRLLQDDVNASSAQVFAGNVPKGHIAITQRDPKLESHLSSFVCTGVL